MLHTVPPVGTDVMKPVWKSLESLASVLGDLKIPKLCNEGPLRPHSEVSRGENSHSADRDFVSPPSSSSIASRVYLDEGAVCVCAPVQERSSGRGNNFRIHMPLRFWENIKGWSLKVNQTNPAPAHSTRPTGSTRSGVTPWETFRKDHIY